MSIRFLADADLDYAIVQGVRRREPAIDFNSANDAGLEGLPDNRVLEVAAEEGRVLVSHDKHTMPVQFAARIRSGRRSPGVLLALPGATVGDIVDSLLIIWSSSREEEWTDQIHYLPSLSRHVFRQSAARVPKCGSRGGWGVRHRLQTRLIGAFREEHLRLICQRR